MNRATRDSAIAPIDRQVGRPVRHQVVGDQPPALLGFAYRPSSEGHQRPVLRPRRRMHHAHKPNPVRSQPWPNTQPRMTHPRRGYRPAKGLYKWWGVGRLRWNEMCPSHIVRRRPRTLPGRRPRGAIAVCPGKANPAVRASQHRPTTRATVPAPCIARSNEPPHWPRCQSP